VGRVDLAWQDKIAVMTLAGDVSFDSLARLQDVFSEATKTTRRIAVDLSETEFLGSAAVGMLLSRGLSLTKAGGGLMLCNVSQKVRSLLELLGIHDCFRICGTVDDGIRQLKAIADRP